MNRRPKPTKFKRIRLKVLRFNQNVFCNMRVNRDCLIHRRVRLELYGNAEFKGIKIPDEDIPLQEVWWAVGGNLDWRPTKETVVKHIHLMNEIIDDIPSKEEIKKKLWAEFMERVKIADKVDTLTFLGSVERYRKIFMGD